MAHVKVEVTLDADEVTDLVRDRALDAAELQCGREPSDVDCGFNQATVTWEWDS